MNTVISKTQKIKDKTTNNNTDNSQNINGKILLIFKQQWDKIEQEYDTIMKKFDKFTKLLSNPEIQKEFKSLISSLNTFKNNFKNNFFNLGINIGNISYNDNIENNK